MGLFVHGQTLDDAINMRLYTCVKGGVVRLRMRVSKVYGAKIVVGSKMKNEWNKWKNHYYEMKGDVGLSLHEKERNKMPTPRHKVTHNTIPTSLFLPRPQHTFSCRQCQDVVLFALPNAFITNKQTICQSKTKMYGWGYE